MLIHECSRGIPRTMSVICDNALISGFAAGRQPVGRDIIEEVARDFDLKRLPFADEPCGAADVSSRAKRNAARKAGIGRPGRRTRSRAAAGRPAHFRGRRPAAAVLDLRAVVTGVSLWGLRASNESC